MPRSTNTVRRVLGHDLTVEEYDSPLRFMVQSQSKPEDRYLVDLEEWSCTCPDFEMRHGPKLKKGGERKDHFCKHQAAAFHHIAWLMVDKLIEIRKEQEGAAKFDLY
jgi:hypothetical protein